MNSLYFVSNDISLVSENVKNLFEKFLVLHLNWE